MHWDHESLAATRRTESADKSDALQTLRAGPRRPAVAKRLECVRLQRRFSKVGSDSMVGSVHGKSGCVLKPPSGVRTAERVRLHCSRSKARACWQRPIEMSS